MRFLKKCISCCHSLSMALKRRNCTILSRQLSTRNHFEDPEHVDAYVKFRSNIPSQIILKLIGFVDESYNSAECVAVDVGCGSGQSTIPLACAFKNVTGIDVSEAQIKAAKKRMLDNVDFVVGNGENIPFPDSSVHLVATVNAVHWLNLDNFFREVDRVLVPRGVLALVRGSPRIEIEGHEDDSTSLFDQLKRDTKIYWDPSRVENDYLYDSILLPYRESIRDKSLILEEILSVNFIVERVKTYSGIAKLLRDDPVKANQMLDQYRTNLMKIVGAADKSPDNTMVTLRRQFILLMGRKH